jgi:diguanylate cyclase (GGDEF)-like protein
MAQRSPTPLTRYVTAVSLVGCVVLGATVVSGGDLPIGEPGFWVLAALVFVGELFPIQVHGQEGEETFSTTFGFALLFLFGFPAVVLVQALTSLVSDIRGRRPIDRILFNLAQLSISWLAAYLVLRALLGPGVATGAWSLEGVAAAFLAGAAFFVANSTLVRIAEAIVLQVRVYRHLVADLGFRAWASGMLLGLAVPVAAMADYQLALVPLVALPMAAIHRSSRQASEMEHLALHDPLTGLANRSLFEQRAQAALASADKTGRGVAVLLLDLDRFKDINDTLGHRQGDALLLALAERLESSLRAGDAVARFGGDEFALLLRELPSAEQAEAAARAVIERLSAPLKVADIMLTIDASVGVACFPAHGADVDVLLQHADSAMYRAKGAHSGVELFCAELDAQSPIRLAMVTDLRAALDNQRLRLEYQPKLDLATLEVVGFEALARWDHPVLGPVPPQEFVQLAENTGLIGRLTDEVIRMATRDAAIWGRTGWPLPVAVNISAQSVLDDALLEALKAHLDRNQLPGEMCEIELTESVLMADPEKARVLLTSFRALGCSVSIDDFGTGYSSLAYLQRLHVDTLKIDRSFIRGIENDPDAIKIVQAIVELGHNLGISIIAEGIETTSNHESLLAMGCPVGQGYLFARPMPLQDLLSWLHGNHAKRQQPGAPPPAHLSPV